MVPRSIDCLGGDGQEERNTKPRDVRNTTRTCGCVRLLGMSSARGFRAQHIRHHGPAHRGELELTRSAKSLPPVPDSSPPLSAAHSTSISSCLASPPSPYVGTAALRLVKPEIAGVTRRRRVAQSSTPLASKCRAGFEGRHGVAVAARVEAAARVEVLDAASEALAPPLPRPPEKPVEPHRRRVLQLARRCRFRARILRYEVPSPTAHEPLYFSTCARPVGGQLGEAESGWVTPANAERPARAPAQTAAPRASEMVTGTGYRLAITSRLQPSLPVPDRRRVGPSCNARDLSLARSSNVCKLTQYIGTSSHRYTYEHAEDGEGEQVFAQDVYMPDRPPLAPQELGSARPMLDQAPVARQAQLPHGSRSVADGRVPKGVVQADCVCRDSAGLVLATDLTALGGSPGIDLALDPHHYPYTRIVLLDIIDLDDAAVLCMVSSRAANEGAVRLREFGFSLIGSSGRRSFAQKLASIIGRCIHGLAGKTCTPVDRDEDGQGGSDSGGDHDIDSDHYGDHNSDRDGGRDSGDDNDSDRDNESQGSSEGDGDGEGSEALWSSGVYIFRCPL
ncbi:hypothetical protein EV715DRAFT_267791 [Schizophyllum commune]